MSLSKYFGGMDEGNYTIAINKIIDALNSINNLSSYLSASDTTAIQGIGSTTQEQAITFNTVEINSGITIADNSKITLPSIGSYLIVFSALCYTSSNQAQTVDIWLRKNGNTLVPRSSTRATIPSQGHYMPMTVSSIIEATTVGDFYELMMCGSSASNTGIATIAASGDNPERPITPSIIVTVNKISL